MKSKYFFIAFIAAWLFVIPANAQNETAIANEADSVFTSYLAQINYWSNIYRFPSMESDSLVQPNMSLMKYARKALLQPQTISAPFPYATDKGLMVTSSEDGKLRFYAWDTWIGGSMHVFNALMQYMSGDSVKLKVLNDIATFMARPNPGSYCTDIKTMYTRDKKTVYLVTDCSIASDNDRAYGIRAYEIENGTINAVPFFRQGKLTTTSLNYAFNSVPGTDTIPHEYNMVHMSDDKSKLYVPIVNNNGVLSDYFAEFRFDGDYFILKRKTKKG